MLQINSVDSFDFLYLLSVVLPQVDDRWYYWSKLDIIFLVEAWYATQNMLKITFIFSVESGFFFLTNNFCKYSTDF